MAMIYTRAMSDIARKQPPAMDEFTHILITPHEPKHREQIHRLCRAISDIQARPQKASIPKLYIEFTAFVTRPDAPLQAQLFFIFNAILQLDELCKALTRRCMCDPERLATFRDHGRKMFHALVHGNRYHQIRRLSEPRPMFTVWTEYVEALKQVYTMGTFRRVTKEAERQRVPDRISSIKQKALPTVTLGLPRPSPTQPLSAQKTTQ